MPIKRHNFLSYFPESLAFETSIFLPICSLAISFSLLATNAPMASPARRQRNAMVSSIFFFLESMLVCFVQCCVLNIQLYARECFDNCAIIINSYCCRKNRKYNSAGWHFKSGTCIKKRQPVGLPFIY